MVTTLTAGTQTARVKPPDKRPGGRAELTILKSAHTSPSEVAINCIAFSVRNPYTKN